MNLMNLSRRNKIILGVVPLSILIIVGIVLIVALKPKPSTEIEELTPPDSDADADADSDVAPPDSFQITNITNDAGEQKNTSFLGTYELSSVEDTTHGVHQWRNTSDPSRLVNIYQNNAFHLGKESDGVLKGTIASVNTTDVVDPRLYSGGWTYQTESRLITFV